MSITSRLRQPAIGCIWGGGEAVEKTPLPNPENNPVIDLTAKPPRKKYAKTAASKQAPNSNYYSEILDKELAQINDEKEIKKLKAQALAGKFIIDFQEPEELWYRNIDKVVKIYPVPETLKSRRDIVLKTKAYFRLQRLSGYERTQHPDYQRLRTHLHIITQKNSYDRALRLFDSIISIYEALGGKMRYEEGKTSVEFADVEIKISIDEKNKRVPIDEEERRWGSMYKFVPSGMLLRISVSLERWRSAEIEDTTYTKVEDKLESVIRKTLSLVKSELDLQEQRRREEIERRKREEERRREEERLRQLEINRNKERDHVRDMFKTIKREMIITIIDRVLQNYGYPEVPENPDTATGAYVIKLRSLKNLFDPHRTTPIDSILTESDINSLTDEFFGYES